MNGEEMGKYPMGATLYRDTFFVRLVDVVPFGII